ncbi:NAD(P)/FAD-dependent oxidoreductase [Chitinophaga qingshengii]|uniref:FAD-binding oxidoreductase n=1 Tax=Chitinophaga qingshengii TaxID=1569794 RepID=A0ABR7TVA9_9BACT|nr:FAD-binding oxidoreductase [Chitinophaga qingshengii]MBC9933933.1 FAD-binding oxidoreductase [Chitinophaga qingshengii]
MTSVDYIIVGQGIAGTMLSWSLWKAGKKVLVIDDAKFNSASRVAAGIINPVSGRRFEPAWMYDTIYPFARDAYQQVSDILQVPVLTERRLWNVFPSQQMYDAFMKKAGGGQYTSLPEQPEYEDILDQPYGAAIVKGATVNLRELLPAWRQFLAGMGALLETHLELSALEVTATGIRYGDIAAKKIIFCDGMATAKNPWFSKLTFLPNKGEVLMVRVPGLHTADIIKKSITLVPYGPELFWAGSSFVWDYTDDLPTGRQREVLEKSLQQLLKVPYTVETQLAAVRPSGNDRRPMIGMHPEMPAVGIFNGLGTKGCSLAPFMAAHFTEVLAGNALLMPEVDINRYFNISRG